jgi:hypothetical protein
LGTEKANPEAPGLFTKERL